MEWLQSTAPKKTATGTFTINFDYKAKYKLQL